MAETRYLIRKGRLVRERRRSRYGHDAPAAVNRILDDPHGRPGALGAILLLTYLIIGSPRDRLVLFYRFFTDRDTPRKSARIEALARELRGRLAAERRVLTGYFERRLYSRDLARVPSTLEKVLHRTTPLLVVQPHDEEDVLAVLAFAGTHRLPIFPRGTASSAFGGAVPTMNGVVIDFSAMTGVPAIAPADRTARVLPGTRWADLAQALEPHGLEPMTTPTSRFSTVAGWASTGGIGLNGWGYGHLSEAIVAARVALPVGKVLALDGTNPALRDFIGTEGQFGVFTELTLKVRERPLESLPRLYCFDDTAGAMAFVDRVASGGPRPSHVAVYDRVRMEEENRSYRDLTGRMDTVVPEKDSVLVHFERSDEWRSFAGDLGAGGADEPKQLLAARWLWSERFFPLKAQRTGPGMLAAEVVLDRNRVQTFVSGARRLARRFGGELAIEILASRTAGADTCVVIASFLCDKSRGIDYLFRLLLVQLMTHLGVRLGGSPYGFGIWNSPYLARRYSAVERRRVETLKTETDPAGLLNPHKHLRARSRLFTIPGLLFAPRVFATALTLARLVSPILGIVARLTRGPRYDRWRAPPADGTDGRRLLVESAARCVFCGACISTCPAWLVTRDELVTGRAKLRLAEAIAEHETILAREAASPFQCFHCGLCEEVCQTRLPLRDCYTALEAELEQLYGRPRDTIAAFIERADRDRAFIRETFGVSLPDWTPAGPPAAEPPSQGGTP